MCPKAKKIFQSWFIILLKITLTPKNYQILLNILPKFALISPNPVTLIIIIPIKFDPVLTWSADSP